MDKNILDFYSDDYEEIRKVLGTPDSPDNPGFYLLTVGMILSDDPVERHIADLKSQHNSSLHSYYARKELMERGIIDESGRIINSEWISDDIKPEKASSQKKE